MRKSKPKFWRGLIVMCGDDPILIKSIEKVDYFDGIAAFNYQDQNGTWWSEDSLYRITMHQAGYTIWPEENEKSAVYYRRKK